MTIQSIIVLVIVFVLLALAILFICQHGGWQGGCGGNCANGRQECSAPIELELNKRKTAYVTMGREMRGGGGIDNHYPSYVGRDAGRMKF